MARLALFSVVKCIAFIAFIFASTYAQADDSDDNEDGETPKTPPQISTTFETVIRVQLPDQKKLVELKIAYDQGIHRGAIIRNEGGKREHFIYALDTGKFLKITKGVPSTCIYDDIVTGQEKFEESTIYFPFFVNEAQNMIAKDGADVLKLGTGLEFQEYSEVDKYKTSSWKKETFTQKDNLKCTVEVIFTDPNAYTLKCEFPPCPAVPLNIKEECPKADGIGSVKRELDFFEFNNEITDQTIFQIPPGVFCANFTPESQEMLPELSPVWSAKREVFSALGNVRMEESIWYDGKILRTRVDHEEFVEGEDQMYKSIEYTMINDYVHGVSYQIQNMGAKCEMHSTRDALPRPVAVLLDIDEHDEISQVKIGQKPCRGNAPCEVWALQVPGRFRDGGNNKQVQNAYFTLTQTQNSGDYYEPVYSELYQDLPFQNETKSVKKINIYHYQLLKPDVNVFDVSSCFKSSQKSMLTLKVKGPRDMITHEAKHSFGQDVMNTLRAAMGLQSTVRLNNLKMNDIDYETTLINVVLVEDPHKAGLFGDDPVKDVPLKQAIENLKDAIEDGLEMTFTDADENEQKFVFQELSVGTHDVEKLVKQPDSSKKYTGGDLAGAVFGTLFLGILVSVLALFACFKFRKDLLVSFLRANK